MNRRENKKFISLRYKFLGYAMAIAVIPMLFMGMILYLQSQEIVKKNENTARVNVLAQIAENIETTMEYVDDLSVMLIQDDAVREWLIATSGPEKAVDELKRLAVQRRLSYCVGNKRYIAAIMIENLKKEVAFTGTGWITSGKENAAINQASDEKKGRLVWVTSSEKWEEMNEGARTLFMFRNINDINSGKKLGMVKIEIFISEIAKMFANEVEDDQSITYMIDNSNTVIAAADTEKIGSVLPEQIGDILSAESEMTEVTLEHEKYLVVSYGIADTDWTLVNLIPTENMLSDSRVLMRTMLICLASSLILCIVFSVFFSRIYTNPLIILSRRLSKLDMKSITMRSSNDEVGVLVHTYNTMSDRIEHLADEAAQNKLSAMQAEFAALQAQINPHALYNNLDTAYWLSRLETAPKTGELLLALSMMYRKSLGNVNEVITIEEEKEYLDYYMTIQRFRLEDQVNLTYELSEEVYGLYTLRFVLQPLVENAILHGILPKGEEGSILLQIFLKEEKLWIQITDDGVGSNANTLNAMLNNGEKADPQKPGFAIKNVHDRVTMRFGAQYGLRYLENKDGGTCVIICQPILKKPV